MRQAGRYMKSYQELRNRYDFLTMVKTPELACQITLQPVEEFAPDAAIIFADILPILDAMGLSLQFINGDGPVINNPITSETDIDNLRAINPAEDLAYTLQAIRLTKLELAKRHVPLIGFSGAPFTLAYYAIEGISGATGIKTLSLMHKRADLWHRLMTKLRVAVIDYLRAQVDSGADALQLFDSWAGLLSPQEYEIYVLPHVCYIVDSLKESTVPITYFSTQTTSYIDILNKIPCHVLGIDWRIDLKKAWTQKSPSHALQGNLSPHILLGCEQEVRREVRLMLESLNTISPELTGYIFNLGHGIHKETPIKNVHALFDAVRQFDCISRCYSASLMD